MRVGATADSTASGAVDDDLAPPPPPEPIRSPRDRRHRVLARWGFPLALVGLAALTVVFALMGRDAILDSTEGDVVEIVTDPTQPGFRVVVEPTPSALWALVHDGELTGVVLAGLGDAGGGGGVGLLPALLAVDGSGTPTLADVYASGGAVALREAVTAALDIGVDDVVTLDDSGWTTLSAAVAPVTVDLPTDLVADDGTVVHAAGELAVGAGEFGQILAWVSPGEDPAQRVLRQSLLLSAYLAELAEAGPDVVPGEGDVGVPGFLRAFAAGTHVVRVPETTASGDALVAEPAVLASLAVDLVPFPRPVEPGARPTVRLLDGVGDQAATLALADVLVRAGAQLSVLGNADEFAASTTTVTHHTAETRAAAEQIRDALGVGEIRFEPLTADAETSFVDVTVVVGADLAGTPG